MPTTNGTLAGNLRAITALFAGNRNALRFASPYAASFKDTQNHLIGQNIVSKAAQLVNDLESARRAETDFSRFLAQKQTTLKTTAARGSIVNIAG